MCSTALTVSREGVGSALREGKDLARWDESDFCDLAQRDHAAVLDAVNLVIDDISAIRSLSDQIKDVRRIIPALGISPLDVPVVDLGAIFA